MVLVKIAMEAIKLAGRYSKSTVNVDYKLLVKAGWKDPAARGISHGIFAGSIGNYMKESGPIDNDAVSQTKKFNGSSTSKSYKTRSRFKRNSRCKCKQRVHYGSRY